MSRLREHVACARTWRTRAWPCRRVPAECHAPRHKSGLGTVLRSTGVRKRSVRAALVGTPGEAVHMRPSELRAADGVRVRFFK